MSEPNEPKRDDIEERLLDEALREVLGGEAPPDLTDKILAAAEKQVSVSPQPKEQVMNQPRRLLRMTFATAATLLIVAGIGVALMLPAVQSSRETARRAMMLSEAQDSSARSLARSEAMRAPLAANAFLDFESTPPPQGITSPEGRGPGISGDQYERVFENPFRLVKKYPLSTFSIDVDTASYANVRRYLLQEGRLPPPDAVRIEELVNYFDYDYEGPWDDEPFAAHIEAATCPWTEGHRLVRVALKGQVMESEERPACNLVFLLDVSGSMQSPDKLPLLKQGMKLLAEQIRENDRVAIVVYATAEGLALPSTPGSERREILAALDRLEAGGSTAGAAGIELAYRVAQEHFIEGGVNRVLLCTDGDFNVGTTSTAALERMVEDRAKSGVFLSVLGFGRGNLNDAMMERISNKGNGNYAYIDGITEARKVLVEQAGGTLVTIAKDVKIQIEFNPAHVTAYRLIGYENRILAAEDFNDDKKDAGEIGAGHAVTALYEVVPVGVEVNIPTVDPLKYQSDAQQEVAVEASDELMTLKIRYKAPDGDTSQLLEFPFVDSGTGFGQASGDFQFASAVAAFGMLLRGSEHKGSATYDAALEIATAARGPDVHGYRAELLEMVRRARELSGG
jgi:Ca-activated chloride channel family protein